MSCNKVGGKRSKKGGSGASGYGQHVWGNGAQQHSISSDTNVIAVTNDPSKYTGGDLTTIGVPAVLIAANQIYKPNRTNKYGKGKKMYRTNKRYGKSRRMQGGSDLDAMMKQTSDMMNKMGPTTMPAVVNSNAAPPAIPSNVQVFGGNVKQTGAGIITDIAVPAVLLTANHLYKRKTGKKSKRSRRVTFRRRYRR